MKIGILLLGIIFLVKICSIENEYTEYTEYTYEPYKEYTNEQLQKFIDGPYPLGTYFWDEFNFLKGQYELSEAESLILGGWRWFEQISSSSYSYRYGYSYGYEFFPNKLAIAGVSGHTFKNNPHIGLGTLVGTWSIENNILTMTVIGYLTYGGAKREYIKCTPYKINIIDISYIDPIGYSKIPMAGIIVPQELQNKLDPRSMRHTPVRLARALLHHSLSRDGYVYYGFFTHVEEMARRNLTGEQIAHSPELVYEFIENFPDYSVPRVNRRTE